MPHWANLVAAYVEFFISNFVCQGEKVMLTSLMDSD